MKKVIFILSGFIVFALLMSTWSYLYITEAKTTYVKEVTVELYHRPAGHPKGMLIRPLFYDAQEKHAVFLRVDGKKRILSGKEMYEKMKPWDGKKVRVTYREHPFRFLSINLASS